jgi:hypothetical protein
LGADLFLSKLVSLGLQFEHLDLGEEGGNLWRTGTIKLTRDLNGLWFRLRVYPWRSESIGAFVTIAGGPVWQSADASGVAWSPVQPDVDQPFSCEGCDTVDVGLRGAIGIEGSPTPPVRFWTSLGFDTYRMSDAVLDNCAPGAGTAAVFGLRAGMAYEISFED